MFSRLLGIFGITYPSLLSEDERKQATEAKERTKRLLSDVLKKKESLLVEDLKVFSDLKLENHYPLITTHLVEELSRELEKVTFAKNRFSKEDLEANAYVYRCSDDRTIYLCAPFWKMDPESKSQQKTIIHEVSHFLGYGHTVQENSERVKTSPQSMLCPLTAYSVASALTSSMDHRGPFTDGSYSCCGETSRDTVCDKSWVCYYVRSMCKVERLWKQILLVQRHSDGDETDTNSDDTDVSDDESDTCSVRTDTSCEDADTSDDEIHTSGEQTDPVVQREKRWMTLMKRQNSLLMKQKNLMKKQINLMKKQQNLMKMQNNVLKTKANSVKTLEDQFQTKADLVTTKDEIRKTLADMLETEADMLTTLVYMVMTMADTVKLDSNLVKIKAEMVKIMVDTVKIKARTVKRKADMVKREADMVKRKVDMLKTQADTLKINPSTVKTVSDISRIKMLKLQDKIELF